MINMLGLLVAVLMSWAALARAQCPNGFMHHGASCYAVPDTEATWAQATLYCKILGSDLAVVDSADEQHYLEGFLQRMAGGFVNDHDFWIGGGDFLEEGTWIWTKSQSLIDPTATFWAPGQPSNTHQHQACLRMSENLHYKWEDGSCDSPEYFICEKPFGIGGGDIIG
ncbi:perlucin-like [Babylonia areolata]|uniref:perlucin-like n=1 Tax=Babylonia areolata TaxID=304850 RepID=UPI003FD0123B